MGITPDFYLETASFMALFTTSFSTFIAPFSMSFASKPSSLSKNTSYSSLELSTGTICTKVSRPSSYKSLSLASSMDVKVIPNVRFNYFFDPTDLARYVKALKKVGALLKTKSLAGFKFDKGLEGELGFKFLGPSL